MVNLSRQQFEIYLYLKEHHTREVTVDEFTQKEGLNIASYTERMSELRKKGYQVINTRKNHYQLQGEPVPTLQDLKEIWTAAKKRGYTNLMKRCELKAQEINLLTQAREALL